MLALYTFFYLFSCSILDVVFTDENKLIQEELTSTQVSIIPWENDPQGWRNVSIRNVHDYYEHYCNLSWHPTYECPPGNFNCGQYCIPSEFTCDGVVDCFDFPRKLSFRGPPNQLGKANCLEEAMDEKNCANYPCDFMCTPATVDFKEEKFCVPYREVCDTMSHCNYKFGGFNLNKYPNEDEVGCHNWTDGHASNAFKCKLSGKFISRQAVCDFDLEFKECNYALDLEYFDRSCSVQIAYINFQVSHAFVKNFSCLVEFIQGNEKGCISEYSSEDLIYEKNEYGVNLFKRRYSHCDPEPLEQPKWLQTDYEYGYLLMALYYCYLNDASREELGREKDIIQIDYLTTSDINLMLRDHSDEENCPGARFDFPSIYPEKVTDCGHDIDCGDGTCARDLMECQNRYRVNKCYPGGFYCHKRCVQPCDGRCDCYDCEDEDKCNRD